MRVVSFGGGGSGDSPSPVYFLFWLCFVAPWCWLIARWCLFSRDERMSERVKGYAGQVVVASTSARDEDSKGGKGVQEFSSM